MIAPEFTSNHRLAKSSPILYPMGERITRFRELNKHYLHKYR